MSRHKYLKKELIILLKKWAQQHGEVPSQSQWDEDANTPSSNPCRCRFGSWSKALIAAGLEPKKPTFSALCRENSVKARRGKAGGNNKGGRIKDRFGYILLWKPGHPNAKVGRNKSYVAEHRFVMSEHLKRPLEKWEFIHHKNGIKDDNRLENLELLTKKNHRGKVLCPYCNQNFFIR